MTYQGRIESTPEWRFDSSMLLRFGLYLLIPVGSMLGGVATSCSNPFHYLIVCS